jgi:hypothetical protein
MVSLIVIAKLPVAGEVEIFFRFWSLPARRTAELSTHLAPTRLRGFADKSRTRHCPPFVVSNNSARYGTGRTRSMDMGSIRRRKTSDPETIGRKSRMCFPECSDQYNSVLSTKKSSF